MPEFLEISTEFEKALQIISKTNNHLFITGKAGTGKSTLLEYCAKNCNKNLVMLAPTGIAALNIKGQTIHRFFGFPINITVEKIISQQFLPRAKRIYKNLETIIIDEASMLRADILDCINAFLELYGPKPGKTLGGVQIILVGDLYQLPPVISKQEQIYFLPKYSSPYFFSSETFQRISMEVIELNKVYRQKDSYFISLLNRFRNNTINNDDIIQLNSHINTEQSSHKLTDCRISLTTTNQLADNINKKHLDALEGITYCSEAIIDGNFNEEYYPTPKHLFFKIGSQIMFLNNDAKKRWVNGTLGYIEKVSLENGKVKHVSVRLQNNHKLIEVFPYNWEIFKYTFENKEIISDIVGSFSQFPFRLAWAVTIHKSQGKTFDYVNIDIGNGTFAPGQLYVALSRCTSFAGVSLAKPINKQHAITDNRIINFLSQYIYQEISDEQRLNILKNNIIKRKKIEITYTKANGEQSRRIIIPLNIKNDKLLAFCTQRQEQRTFILERIKNIHVIEDK